MPKVDLTMNQWGLVLVAVKATITTCREEAEYGDETAKEDLVECLVAEDKIIDMAFEEAKRKRGEQR